MTAFFEFVDGVVDVTVGTTKSRRGALELQLQEAKNTMSNVARGSLMNVKLIANIMIIPMYYVRLLFRLSLNSFKRSMFL